MNSTRLLLCLGILATASCADSRADEPPAPADSRRDAGRQDLNDAGAPPCEVGTVRCQAGVVERCEGTSWRVAETCEFGCEQAGLEARCVVSCDACPSEGATVCMAGATRTCSREPSGCLEWGASSACESGTCANGTSCNSALPSGSVYWAQGFGALGLESAIDVASDRDGNIVVVGNFERTVSFGGVPLESVGGRDGFVASYGPDGSHRWSRALGGTSDDRANGVTVLESGDVVVAGTFSGTGNFGGSDLVAVDAEDFFLARFDTEGNHLDSRSFGGGPGFGAIHAVQTAPNGDLLLAGFLSGNADFGGAQPLTRGFGWDVFIARFTASGAHVWSKRFSTDRWEWATGVAIDRAGDVIVTGVYRGPLDFGGGELEADPDGGNRMFLARFDADGRPLWSRGFGAGGTEMGIYPRGVVVDGAGEITVTGGFQGPADFGGSTLASEGSVDMFLARYRGDGSHLWSQRFGGRSADQPHDVAVDAGGDITVVGWFGATTSDSFAAPASFGGTTFRPAGLADVFVARYAPDGTHLWSESFGGESVDQAWGVAHDPFGNVIVAGSFYETASFKGRRVTSAGSRDAFLLRLSP